MTADKTGVSVLFGMPRGSSKTTSKPRICVRLLLLLVSLRDQSLFSEEDGLQNGRGASQVYHYKKGYCRGSRGRNRFWGGGGGCGGGYTRFKGSVNVGTNFRGDVKTPFL